MSLASSRVGLTHRCTIERATLTADGAGGQTETWAAVETDIPCRGWLESSRVEVVGEKVVEIEERRVIVPVGTDVQDGDRIVEVSHRGSTYLDGPMPVDTVGRQADHLELRSREVQ